MKEHTWRELLDQAEFYYANPDKNISAKFLHDLNMSEIKAYNEGEKKKARRIIELYNELYARLRELIEKPQKNARKKKNFNKTQSEKTAIEEQKRRANFLEKIRKNAEKSGNPKKIEEVKRTMAVRESALKAASESAHTASDNSKDENSFSENDEEQDAVAAANHVYEQDQKVDLGRIISVAPIPEGFKSVSINRPHQENIKEQNGIDSAFTDINETNSVKLSDGKLYNDVTIMKLYDKAYEKCLKHGHDVNNLNIILREFVSPYKVKFTMHDLKIALSLKLSGRNNSIGKGNSPKPANRNKSINSNRNENENIYENINASTKKKIGKRVSIKTKKRD